MCTVVVLRRPDHEWPLLIAANRDEATGRAWQAPGRHWPDRPEVVAGRDLEAGGSWLGMNDHGIVAAILNRRHALGPAAGKRSRGELVLEALDHGDAVSAATALAELNGPAYRSFNMLIADRRDAFWLRWQEGADSHVGVQPVAEGVSILTAWDLNDTERSERTRHFLPLFGSAPVPDPVAGEWKAWMDLVRSRDHMNGAHDPNAAMHVETDWGFGTVCSSLIAVPMAPDVRPAWLFETAWPERAGFAPVDLT